jgi:oligopeptide transport system permease protein
LTKYVVKRVLLAILTVFIVCAITFFAMNAIPGGPFDGEKAISDEVRRVLEQRFNLDKPVWEQFFLYLNNLLHGDFGVSAKTGREIKTTIFNSFGVSAKLGGMAVLVALISGVVLGSIAALTRNRLPDRLIIFFSTLFTSLPSFVLGTLLLLVFCIRLKWIPVWSSSSQNYVLPVIALAAYPMAYITRLTKTSMLDALGQDYVRTARAKGVAQWKVIFKHTLRNALIPVLIGKYCFKSRTSTRYSLLFFTSSFTVCLLFLPPWLPLRSASRMRNDRQAFAFPAAALRYRSSSLPRSAGKMHSPLAYLRG